MTQSATFPDFSPNRDAFGDNEELFQEMNKLVDALRELQSHLYDSSRSTRVLENPNRDFTVEFGETAIHPNLTIPAGITYLVKSGGELRCVVPINKGLMASPYHKSFWNEYTPIFFTDWNNKELTGYNFDLVHQEITAAPNIYSEQILFILKAVKDDNVEKAMKYIHKKEDKNERKEVKKD